MLEKTLERPLDCKEIQPVRFKGDQHWVFFGRNDAKTETPVLWPPHVKSWLIGKDSDAGGDCGQKEKGTTEDEMAGWHHWLNGREFESTPGVGDGRPGVLRFMGSQRVGHDWATELNWTERPLPLFECQSWVQTVEAKQQDMEQGKLSKRSHLWMFTWTLHQFSQMGCWIGATWKWSRSVVSDSLRPHRL